MHEREEERKDSSKGIWLVLIWKYCFTSSELNYWPELAVLRKQAERHRRPRWARSGRQICHRDRGEHMNPCSVVLFNWMDSNGFLCCFWGSYFVCRVSGDDPLTCIFVAYSMSIVKRP